MSKLSEKEIIKYFKEVIIWYRENTPDRVYALNNKDIEMLQGLLDLYNKEKEKNNKLVVAYGGRRYGTEGIVLKEYISKDKVKKVLINSANEDKYDLYDFHSAYEKLFEDFEKILEEE